MTLEMRCDSRFVDLVVDGADAYGCVEYELWCSVVGFCFALIESAVKLMSGRIMTPKLRLDPKI